MNRDDTFINIALSFIFMAFGMNKKKATIAFKMNIQVQTNEICHRDKAKT